MFPKLFLMLLFQRCADAAQESLLQKKSSKGEAFAQLTLVSANRCKMFLRASG
jgi:hypothetical protein